MTGDLIAPFLIALGLAATPGIVIVIATHIIYRDRPEDTTP